MGKPSFHRILQGAFFAWDVPEVQHAVIELVRKEEASHPSVFGKGVQSRVHGAQPVQPLDFTSTETLRTLLRGTGASACAAQSLSWTGFFVTGAPEFSELLVEDVIRQIYLLMADTSQTLSMPGDIPEELSRLGRDISFMRSKIPKPDDGDEDGDEVAHEHHQRFAAALTSLVANTYQHAALNSWLKAYHAGMEDREDLTATTNTGDTDAPESVAEREANSKKVKQSVIKQVLDSCQNIQQQHGVFGDEAGLTEAWYRSISTTPLLQGLTEPLQAAKAADEEKDDDGDDELGPAADVFRSIVSGTDFVENPPRFVLFPAHRGPQGLYALHPVQFHDTGLQYANSLWDTLLLPAASGEPAAEKCDWAVPSHKVTAVMRTEHLASPPAWLSSVVDANLLMLWQLAGWDLQQGEGGALGIGWNPQCFVKTVDSLWEALTHGKPSDLEALAAVTTALCETADAVAAPILQDATLSFAAARAFHAAAIFNVPQVMHFELSVSCTAGNGRLMLRYLCRRV